MNIINLWLFVLYSILYFWMQCIPPAIIRPNIISVLSEDNHLSLAVTTYKSLWRLPHTEAVSEPFWKKLCGKQHTCLSCKVLVPPVLSRRRCGNWGDGRVEVAIDKVDSDKPITSLALSKLAKDLVPFCTPGEQKDCLAAFSLSERKPVNKGAQSQAWQACGVISEHEDGHWPIKFSIDSELTGNCSRVSAGGSYFPNACWEILTGGIGSGTSCIQIFYHWVTALPHHNWPYTCKLAHGQGW